MWRACARAAGLTAGLAAAVGALLAALPVTAVAATPPKTVASACPAPQAAVQEFFLPADCVGCWAEPAAAATSAWRFDWITPTSDSAPLAAGALPEAVERALRLGQGQGQGQGQDVTSTSGGQQVRRQAAHAPLAGLQIRVESGPAWQGYFATQLTLRKPGRAGAAATATTAATHSTALPPGSSAWLALVELVSAGSDGTPVARALVRSVAGPLPLDALAMLKPGQAMTHLRALRWPASAEPLNLQARAWIEGPDGRLLAVVADRCPPP